MSTHDMSPNAGADRAPQTAEELAQAIAAEVADYGADEGAVIDAAHVLRWARQFSADDQLVVLQETRAILAARYITRTGMRTFLSQVIRKFADKFCGGSVPKLLDETAFLDLQERGKSQGDMLDLLDEVISSYGRTSRACGGASPKRYVYVDDVLYTGNTFFQQMKKWWEETDAAGRKRQETLANDVKVVCVFAAVHGRNWHKVRARMRRSLPARAVPDTVWRVVEIENDPTTTGQALDFAFPRRSGVGQAAEAYVASLDVPESELVNVFRADGEPRNERLFTSPDARDRFERVILSKGLELIARVATAKANMRPLGFTLPSHKTLGFGALIFTYRNVANTTPLVFWYEAGGWLPLFKKRQYLAAAFAEIV